ncbi:hypothetical protein BDY21DRAFT_408614, partial [Lineolata rhizophorae]
CYISGLFNRPITAKSSPYPAIQRSQIIPECPISSESRDLVNTWIEICNERHPACVSKHAERPARILDLGFPDRSLDLRLVKTKGDFSRYIALSHCWGGSQPLKTTGDMLEAK